MRDLDAAGLRVQVARRWEGKAPKVRWRTGETEASLGFSEDDALAYTRINRFTVSFRHRGNHDNCGLW